jgi:hypothetical protein
LISIGVFARAAEREAAIEINATCNGSISTRGCCAGPTRA